ncbi:MAG TPA: DNA-directed RNA polymerase subunit beta', partial [Clostridia bacterium]|nr:DNA-directed RNA polymerase subunit beta' [Clostridia bacterium]
RLSVTEGEEIEAGDEITEGSINPHDILKIKGIDGVHRYLLQEVQKVYRMQGIDINDKHIEIIVRQMINKIKVEDAGDTDLLPGSYAKLLDFEEQNRLAEAEGKQPATGERVLLGITKASLATESFLSAASFQETTRVLTDASIKGKIDPLIGLKENVIIGKLIPAGTGMEEYSDYDVRLNDELAKMHIAEAIAAEKEARYRAETEEDEEDTEALIEKMLDTEDDLVVE